MKLWGLAVVFVWPAAAQVSTGLDNLYQSNRWFEFRDAVLHAPEASPFYRGELALAFHDWPQAEKELQAAMRPGGDPMESFEAGMGLLRIYEITGRRKDGRSLLAKLEQSVQALGKSGDIEPEALRLFERYRAEWNAASDYPDQSLAARGPSRLLYSEIGNQLIVPLKIDGAAANYAIDTGSESCVISVAEAKRLGLTVHSAPVEIEDGLDPDMKAAGVAIAGDLIIGNFHFRNVLFLVEEGDEDISGILGLSVLLALDTVRWNSDGTFEFGFPSPPRDLAAANLCFGPMLLTQAALGAKNLLLGVDTGSYESMLFPRFARDFPDRMQPQIPLGERSAPDGTVAVSVSELRIGGVEIPFAPAPVYPQAPVDDASILHGWLGMDLLGRASSVTLDFGAMKVALDGIGVGESTAKSNECPLAPDFRCLPGFNCIVKAAGAEPCFIERVPAEPPPGNPVESEPGGSGTCYLSPGAHCDHAMACRVVFDSKQSCHIESEPASSPAPQPAATATAARAASKAPAPDVDLHDILARSIKYEALNFEPPRDYIFVEHEERKLLKENGEVKNLEREAREVMNLYDARFTRLISKDGRELAPEKARAEQARFDKAVAKRRREQASRADASKRADAERKRNAEQLACDREFLKIFEPHLAGVEGLNGRASWVVELTPAANVEPQCSGLKLAIKFKWKLWIDRADYRWARLQADNIAPVTWLKVLVRVPPDGLHATVDATRHNDGAWLESEFHWNINAKLLLAAGVRIDDRITYTDYRKFQAESRVLDNDQ